ncbi:MAG: MBOAT family protein [Bacteroidales bacterium]|nr:MBOAT family protein [Bacteroidales bacterium]
MIFNSLEYALFLPILFFLYWLAYNKSVKSQNILLLLASYLFYGWWDWRLLLLLVSVSFFNYLIGLAISSDKSKKNKKLLLIAGLVVNLGLLSFFKYFNFFIESFVDLIFLFGYQLKGTAINIILPVGISFYIFLALSYIIDVYKEKIAAERKVINSLLTFGFFPIILAGPIQRPSSLLPQIRRPREFDYNHAVDGLRQILWGLFVKIAIADNLAPWANDIFTGYNDLSGSTLMAGALFYTVQIYADFSGYSHIAIGTASLLGFRLMKNFDYPYFARDINEFWKKWHISLTTWFRDYLFLPISFSISWKIKTEKIIYLRANLFIYIVASLITWFLTGLWHGANYTFILWGMMHGILLIAYHWQKGPRKKLFKRLGINNNNFLLSIVEGFSTFMLIVITWIFFKSDSVSHAFGYLNGMFSKSLFTSPGDLPLKEILIGLAFIIIEFVQRNKDHSLQINGIRQRWLRWGIYIGIILVIMLFGGGTQQFIYFKF